MKDLYIILEKIEGVNNQEFQIGNTEIQGWNRHGIEIGKPLILYSHKNKGVRPHCWTSIVEEVNDNIIKTKNSTYKIKL